MAQYDKVAKRQPRHICVFGPSKTGKTTLVSQLALMGYKLIWFSLDNGHTVLDMLPIEAQQRIDLIVLPDTYEYSIGQDVIRKVIKGGDFNICDIHGMINCSACKREAKSFTHINLYKIDLDTIVVIDHGTIISKSIINKISHQEADKAKKPVDGYKLDFGDWATCNSIHDDILSTLQYAPFNCVLITLEYLTAGEDGSKKIVPALSTLNYANNTPGFFDSMVYCDISGGKHVCGSGSTYRGNIITGSRDNIAIEKMEKPSLAPFFNDNLKKIQRHYGEAIVSTTALLETSNREETSKETTAATADSSVGSNGTGSVERKDAPENKEESRELAGEQQHEKPTGLVTTDTVIAGSATNSAAMAALEKLRRKK